MGLFDAIRSQFIEVIEWLDDSSGTLVYRFPVRGQEIKMGAQLVVREGQAAVFVNEGRLADQFGPGTYTLETRNLPVLTKLRSWPFGFTSPFKAEVYFVSTRRFTDRKWGTQNPIMMRDPEFGVVRLRAFGAFSFRVQDPSKFLAEVSGTEGLFEVPEIEGMLRRFAVSAFTDALAESKIAALDLAASYRELSDTVKAGIAQHFGEHGLQALDFVVENISLPPEVEQMLDKRTSMGVVGDLDRFTRFQTAQAIEAAAQAPGGAMGAGMGMGAGFAMADQMARSLAGRSESPPAAPAAPAPPPGGEAAAASPAVRLKQAKEMLDQGLITAAEFEGIKAKILGSL